MPDTFSGSQLQRDEIDTDGLVCGRNITNVLSRK
jgi:hypothetical protein